MLKTIAGLLLTMVCGAALAQENVPQIADPQMENPATDQPPEAAPAPPEAAVEQPAREPVEYVEDEEFDNRWYLEPAIGLIFSDSKNFDNGYFVSGAIGKPINRIFGFNAEVNYSKLNVTGLSSDDAYKRGTLGVNGLVYLWRGDWEPYLSVGANAHRINFVGERLNGWGLSGGPGILWNLGSRFALDLQARYNVDFINQNNIVLNNKFYVWTASLGLHFKLGEWPLDSDGDGVPDRFDKCPNTPHGVQVDKDGCPLDSDGDGVPDYLDKCPGTPKGVLVDKDGCPLDSDGDGVPDRLDKCPGTPPGVAVDRDGCPLDSDQDGVPDYLDKCPNTLKGLQVDATGCPIKEQILPLDGVHFEFDKTRLTPDSTTILDHVAEALKESPGLHYEIAGHTCNLGSAKYNQGLSQRRAESVRAYLVQKGIPADQITAKGYGLTQPRVPNDSEQHRELNRRVELRILN